MLKKSAISAATAVVMVVMPSRLLVALVRKVGSPEGDRTLDRALKAGFDPDTWLPPILNVPKHQRVTDKVTLDAIATAMSCEEWDSDMMGIVANLVRETGREIGELDDECSTLVSERED